MLRFCFPGGICIVVWWRRRHVWIKFVWRLPTLDDVRFLQPSGLLVKDCNPGLLGLVPTKFTIIARGEGVGAGGLFLFFATTSLRAFHSVWRPIVIADGTALPPAFVDGAVDRTTLFVLSRFLGTSGNALGRLRRRSADGSGRNRGLRWLRR